MPAAWRLLGQQSTHPAVVPATSAIFLGSFGTAIEWCLVMYGRHSRSAAGIEVIGQ